MTETLNTRLAEVFRAVFELPDDADVSGLIQSESESWDSLRHVMLIGALESEFEVQIGTADSMETTSFEEALFLVEDLLTDT